MIVKKKISKYIKFDIQNFWTWSFGVPYKNLYHSLHQLLNNESQFHVFESQIAMWYEKIPGLCVSWRDKIVLHFYQIHHMTKISIVFIHFRLPIVQGGTFSFLAPTFALLNLQGPCPAPLPGKLSHTMLQCLSLPCSLLYFIYTLYIYVSPRKWPVTSLLILEEDTCFAHHFSVFSRIRKRILVSWRTLHFVSSRERPWRNWAHPRIHIARRILYVSISVFLFEHVRKVARAMTSIFLNTRWRHGRSRCETKYSVSILEYAKLCHSRSWDETKYSCILAIFSPWTIP